MFVGFGLLRRAPLPDPPLKGEGRDRGFWFFGFSSVGLLWVLAVQAQAADSVDPAFCRALTKHTADADVAYQPGVDVHGKSVISADVDGAAQMKLPDQIKIPLTLNLAKVLNLNTANYPASQLGAGTEVQLGVLVVEGDRVLFNGQPLSDTQQDRLAVLCMTRR